MDFIIKLLKSKLKMEIVLIGYRKWALNAFSKFKNLKSFSSTQDLELFLESRNSNEKLCLVFAGWSEIIKSQIIEKYICVCLHPSDLPYFRGGTPIQHQKIRGITESKLTAFRMDNGIDTGPIIYKTDISLKGHMKDIFLSLENASIEIIQIIIENSNVTFLTGQTQDELKATCFKRRNLSDSEITIEDLTSLSSNVLYDKICALEDPYPNAFIKTIDNKKLLLKYVEIE